MKKRTLVTILALIGIALLFLSIILTFIVASKTNIIGGVGLPTLKLVFLHWYGGLFSTMAFLGVVSILVALIVGLTKKRPKK